MNILMEATPADVNVAQLVRDIIRLPAITDVHDLHIWSIAGGMRALSAHVQVDDRPLSACDPLLGQINRLLQDRYKITHTTIQFECLCSAPDDLYCRLNGTAQPDHEHHDHEHTTDWPCVHQSRGGS